MSESDDATTVQGTASVTKWIVEASRKADEDGQWYKEENECESRAEAIAVAQKIRSLRAYNSYSLQIIEVTRRVVWSESR